MNGLVFSCSRGSIGVHIDFIRSPVSIHVIWSELTHVVKIWLTWSASTNACFGASRLEKQDKFELLLQCFCFVLLCFLFKTCSKTTWLLEVVDLTSEINSCSKVKKYHQLRPVTCNTFVFFSQSSSWFRGRMTRGLTDPPPFRFEAGKSRTRERVKINLSEIIKYVIRSTLSRQPRWYSYLFPTSAR